LQQGAAEDDRGVNAPYPDPETPGKAVLSVTHASEFFADKSAKQLNGNIDDTRPVFAERVLFCYICRST